MNSDTLVLSKGVGDTRVGSSDRHLASDQVPTSEDCERRLGVSGSRSTRDQRHSRPRAERPVQMSNAKPKATEESCIQYKPVPLLLEAHTLTSIGGLGEGGDAITAQVSVVGWGGGRESATRSGYRIFQNTHPWYSALGKVRERR